MHTITFGEIAPTQDDIDTVQGKLSFATKDAFLAYRSPKINIPEAELDLLSRKLKIARLPTNLASQQWGESNGVTVPHIDKGVQYWQKSYDWRAEEKRLNEVPQFTTPIEVDSFGTLSIHFAHAKSLQSEAIPVLFLHGWPGNFAESYKMIPKLNHAGFDVVSPSLPGYGFSSYPDKAGFKHVHHAEVMHRLMQRLGYSRYVVQGGDWGFFIARCLAIMYPDHVTALHVNMVGSCVLKIITSPRY